MLAGKHAEAIAAVKALDSESPSALASVAVGAPGDTVYLFDYGQNAVLRMGSSHKVTVLIQSPLRGQRNAIFYRGVGICAERQGSGGIALATGNAVIEFGVDGKLNRTLSVPEWLNPIKDTAAAHDQHAAGQGPLDVKCDSNSNDIFAVDGKHVIRFIPERYR
jgi:hypothetical protein